MMNGRVQVANFIWHGERVSDEEAWLESSDDERSRFSGQFAFEGADRRGRSVLARDRLGVNKLFFTLAGGSLQWSNFLLDLRREGIGLDQIWSVPSGHSVHIGETSEDFELRKHASLPYHQGGEAASPEHYARDIRAGLERTFERIAGALGDRPVFVTMSGGLDSTTIASLARQYLPDVQGVTFSLTDHHDEEDSEDARFAMRVAEDLDIPIRLVRCTTESIMELLDEVLLYGQDYRDFNVHCGLVNAVLGREIAATLASTGPEPGNAPVLLTGDTMNELMADYSAVDVDGRLFYELPRLDKGRLRRFLVNGLDSGDREVGIFARYGLDTIQPYALCAELYTALPGSLIAEEDSKQALVKEVMGDRVPEYVLHRPKVRAQAGDAAAGQGILGAFARAGIDQAELTSRFARLFDATLDETKQLIRTGFYRFPNRLPGGQTHAGL
jgi:asparagine synthetase B (glutamine-hydrolysing)